jgi:hypothetical protein
MDDTRKERTKINRIRRREEHEGKERKGKQAR